MQTTISTLSNSSFPPFFCTPWNGLNSLIITVTQYTSDRPHSSQFHRGSWLQCGEESIKVLIITMASHWFSMIKLTHFLKKMEIITVQMAISLTFCTSNILNIVSTTRTMNKMWFRDRILLLCARLLKIIQMVFIIHQLCKWNLKNNQYRSL